MLTTVGFTFSPQQLFWLIAVPNLVGSLLRLPYTFAVPKFGGRNWAVFSAHVSARRGSPIPSTPARAPSSPSRCSTSCASP
jgi:hypothetical protein